jgi:hypothetical protein
MRSQIGINSGTRAGSLTRSILQAATAGFNPAAWPAALLLFVMGSNLTAAPPGTPSTPPEKVVTEQDRQHWSYLPLRRPALPRVAASTASLTPVDRFIQERLSAKGLTGSRRAEPEKLIRRLYFGLIGLPPTPQQVAAFAEAAALNPSLAVEKLIDDLLASPHYGERWARHWLDVVRYADSDGQEGDADRPTAHHFRDFVIRSLNEDLPFDTFVRWQLAGDELEPDNPSALAATGFIVAGTHAVLPDRLMEEERIRTRFNELDDMIATTGAAMMGLTLGCARCHDHKYDPIPRRDYYRLLCAFNSGDRAELPLLPWEQSRHQRKMEAEWKAELDAATQRWDHVLKQTDKSELKARQKEKDEVLKTLKARKPRSVPTALGFEDADAKPRDTFLLARGDFKAKSEPVQLGFLSVLTRGKSPEDYWSSARNHQKRPDSTQQRRALAEWMTDGEHGAGNLVARVIVNRVWQHHFGEGLVRTVNDFGARCDPPTHPELMEWLTAEFVKGGWRLKPLHRLILASSVYLQDTTFDPDKAKKDPDNRLLWRRRPQRLESEILRDTMLAISGTLNPRMFGPAVKAPVAPEAIQARNMKDPYPPDIKDTPSTHRRSVYLFHKRVVQQPLMQAFDGPDAQASCGRRENTTVAPQALALLNDPFVRARAADFALRLRREAGPGTDAQTRLAWKLALGRDPSSDELKAITGLVSRQIQQRLTAGVAPTETRTLALEDLCQAIFALNEFIYVD